MTTWDKHIELICNFCDVRKVTPDAVWYFEDGCGYCEFRGGDSYSCNSLEEFEMLREMDDGEGFAE